MEDVGVLRNVLPAIHLQERILALKPGYLDQLLELDADRVPPERVFRAMRAIASHPVEVAARLFDSGRCSMRGLLECWSKCGDRIAELEGTIDSELPVIEVVFEFLDAEIRDRWAHLVGEVKEAAGKLDLVRHYTGR